LFSSSHNLNDVRINPGVLPTFEFSVMKLFSTMSSELSKSEIRTTRGHRPG